MPKPYQFTRVVKYGHRVNSPPGIPGCNFGGVTGASVSVSGGPGCTTIAACGGSANPQANPCAPVTFLLCSDIPDGAVVSCNVNDYAGG